MIMTRNQKLKYVPICRYYTYCQYFSGIIIISVIYGGQGSRLIDYYFNALLKFDDHFYSAHLRSTTY